LNICRRHHMNTSLRILSALAVATLAACASNAPMANKAAAPAKTETMAAVAADPVRVFADFGKNPKASNQGSGLTAITYSERKGDAQMESVGVVGDAVVYKGQIGNAKGSNWAGVGFNVSHSDSDKTLDMTAYKSLRIKLSSPTVTSLRLRIAANDSKINNMGCYPIFIQSVTPTMTEYTIPVARFAPEDFCGSNARAIKDTINKVSLIEVVDIANTRNKPTEFSVGKIEFVQ
jgi:hypothetical protein